MAGGGSEAEAQPRPRTAEPANFCRGVPRSPRDFLPLRPRPSLRGLTPARGYPRPSAAAAEQGGGCTADPGPPPPPHLTAGRAGRQVRRQPGLLRRGKARELLLPKQQSQAGEGCGHRRRVTERKGFAGPRSARPAALPQAACPARVRPAACAPRAWAVRLFCF